MKITRQRLKQVIKEEISNALNDDTPEDRAKYIAKHKAHAPKAPPRLRHPSGDNVSGEEFRWYDTDEEGAPVGGYSDMSKEWRKADISAKRNALKLEKAEQ
jgi:hypothetical protein